MSIESIDHIVTSDGSVQCWCGDWHVRTET